MADLSMIALIVLEFEAVVLRNLSAFGIGLAMITIRLVFGLSRRAS